MEFLIFYTIYKTTCLINNKIYIGKHQTENTEDNYLGSGKMLSRAIQKHGIENFKKEILHVFDTEEEMNAKEKELVNEEFLKRDDVYNLCLGGQGGFSYLNDGSENHKERCKKARSNRKTHYYPYWFFDDKSVEKRKKSLKLYHDNHEGSFKNKTHSEESKSKISLKMKGTKIGQDNHRFGTCWVNNGIENKQVKKEDLYIYFEKGYNKGRKMKLYNTKI